MFQSTTLYFTYNVNNMITVRDPEIPLFKDPRKKQSERYIKVSGRGRNIGYKGTIVKHKYRKHTFEHIHVTL